VRRLALSLAVLSVLLASPSASAQLLEQADAAELAQSLADALEDQDVCYGWRVTIDDENGSVTEDVGSSLGPGEPVAEGSAQCPRFVLLRGIVDYTSELSEAEDSAYYAIESNLRRPPTVSELEDIGHGADRLLGEKDDEALFNAVGALPLLVADHGEAKPVGFEPGSDLPAEQAGKPTGNQGNDFLRENWAPLIFCLLLVFGGLIWFVNTLRAGRTPTTPSGGR
jgi:hypothetical protein